MSENLNPTGLGTITTPEYADVQIAARRRQSKYPLNRVEVVWIAIVMAGIAAGFVSMLWHVLT